MIFFNSEVSLGLEYIAMFFSFIDVNIELIFFSQSTKEKFVPMCSKLCTSDPAIKGKLCFFAINSAFLLEPFTLFVYR